MRRGFLNTKPKAKSTSSNANSSSSDQTGIPASPSNPGQCTNQKLPSTRVTTPNNGIVSNLVYTNPTKKQSQEVTDELEVLTLPPNENTCAALLPPKVKKALIAVPSFQPLPAIPLSEVAYRIEEVKGKGLGLIASRALRPSELILAERPIMIIPTRWAGGVEEMTKAVHELYNRLPLEGQQAFSALTNVKGPDVDRLSGIQRTNAIQVDLPSNDESYAGICPIISRCNHSCSPNVSRIFNKHTFAMELRATRHIAPSDEIFTSYVVPLLPRSERLEILQTSYKFNCTCPSCSLSPELSAQSDRNRQILKNWDANHITLRQWLADPSIPAKRIIDDSLEALELIELEGLYKLGTEHAVNLMGVNAALMRGEEVVKWGKKTVEMLVMNVGPNSPTLEAMRSISQNPTTHPFWGMRC